ncbi:MAG: glycosyltransferase [Candidatus Omnitrophica bacterium]|nr:glycosyltransferase [Candidatus Omnitrophota bacterium]
MENLKKKVSVIMPAYNEAERIASSIDETARTLNGFSWLWELILIDDGSTDRTYEKALEASLRYPQQVFVRRNPFNQGKGRAIKKAFHYTSGDYVVFLDADLELHPIQLEAMFNIMHLNNADIVIGSKLHPNSIVNYPLVRRIISFAYYLLVKILFNLPCHDTQTGLKLFKAKALGRVFHRILVKEFAFDLEVLVNAHHLGYRIAEAPIVLNTQKRYGRITSWHIYTALWDTLAVFYRMRILRYYDRIDYYRRKNLGQEFRRMHREMSGT